MKTEDMNIAGLYIFLPLAVILRSYCVTFLDKRTINVPRFIYFSMDTYIVGTHWKRLIEMLPMRITTYASIKR